MNTVTSSDGTKIAYDRAGDGPNLILVDGAMTTRSSGSKPQIVNLLAAHFTTFSYDRRRRGDSGDTLPYAVDREIEDIAALIAEAGGTAFLFGHSSGACLALDAALALAPKVEKLAMYEPPYNDDPTAQQAWGVYIKQLTEALAENRRGDAVALFMSYVGVPPERISEVRQAPFFPGMEAVAPTLAYDHTAIMGPTASIPTERAAQILTPTLVMYGSGSYPFMAETAQKLGEVMPHAHVRMLEGQTHEVGPEALAAALDEFFIGASAAGRV
jgi:pimeloyl-ACP methyl ester carboxylesterase